MNGTRLRADVDGEPVAHIEVALSDHSERRSRGAGLAEAGGLFAGEDHRRRVGSRLLREAAGWLRLGRADRLIGSTRPEENDHLAFYARHHFVEVTRTRWSWVRPPPERQKRRTTCPSQGSDQRRRRARNPRALPDGRWQILRTGHDVVDQPPVKQPPSAVLARATGS